MSGLPIETAIAVTAAMLLVLAARRPVARAFGAGWAYALWAIPALRLVLPSLGLVTTDLLLPPAALIPAAGGGTALPPASAGSGQWAPFMLASWAGGAVIFLVLQWLGYRAFLRRLRSDARPARPAFYDGIATFVSRVVDGPVALGLIRRLIVIPADFSRRYSPAERRLAMEHERAHHRRGDLWWNVAALLVLAANWFNPIAWTAFRAFRTDQELACDAAVAARASVDERCDYARALVKAATRPGLVAACAMSDTGDLKRRLRMIARHRVSRIRSFGGLVAVATIALAGFAVGGRRPAELAATPAAAPRPVMVAQAAPAATLAAPAAETAEETSVPVGGGHVREAHAPAPVRLARTELPVPPPALEPPAPQLQPTLAVDMLPAAAPPRDRLAVSRAHLAYFRDVDPARRRQIEAAIARAIANRATATTAASDTTEIVQFAAAHFQGRETFVYRVRIQSNDQGETQ